MLVPPPPPALQSMGAGAPPAHVPYGSSGAPTTGPVAGQIRLAARSVIAIVGVTASMIAAGYDITTALDRRGLLLEYDRGAPVSRDRLVALDDAVQRAAVLSLIGYAIGIVCFLPWFHRAYKNLAAMRRNSHGTGWAIGGWFVPFLNLVRPFQIMNELTSGSGRDRTRPASRLAGWWWGAMILGNVIDRGLFRIEPETFSGFARQDLFSAISDGLWIVTGILVIRLILGITRAQDAWFTTPT